MMQSLRTQPSKILERFGDDSVVFLMMVVTLLSFSIGVFIGRETPKFSNGAIPSPTHSTVLGRYGSLR